jgi:Luciferase-like monooxygenase
MVIFVRHIERCGFESIIVAEHTVLVTRYDSVYPHDSSGRVRLAADCPIPDPLDLLAFLDGHTSRLGLATGVLVLPNHHPVVLAKRAATVDALSGRTAAAVRGRGLAQGRRRGVRGGVRQPGQARRRAVGGLAGTVGRAAARGVVSRRVLRLRQRHVLPQTGCGRTAFGSYRRAQPGGRPPRWALRRRLPAARCDRSAARPTARADARRGGSSGPRSGGPGVSLGHTVTKIDAERAGSLGDQGADRIVLAMPPTTDIEQAKDMLSACAQRLSLAS